jgi:hypothetical protein
MITLGRVSSHRTFFYVWVIAMEGETGWSTAAVTQ